VRIYVPDKRINTINEVLKDLYLLRQSVDYESGTIDSRLKMVDNIRYKIQTLLDSLDDV
tara:strand:- start:540 stop:716 length:177 start_codon:yes stop_codon:yes gene_type:complete